MDNSILLGTIGYHSLSTPSRGSRKASKASKATSKTSSRASKPRRKGVTIPDHGYYIDTQGRERELKPYKIYNVSYRVKGIDFPDVIALSGKLITSEGSRIACRYPQDLSRERAILSRKKNRRQKQRLHRKGIGV